MEHQAWHEVDEQIAYLLLDLGAVSTNTESFFQFVSGIRSPIYIDNRRFISYPEARRKIVSCFVNVVTTITGQSNFDLIAGVATGAIPWSAWIAKELEVPLIYVRSSPKERGLRRQVEGVLHSGQRAVVIEDLITTGRSSSDAVEAIRSAGGIADHCVAIFSFGAPAASQVFRSHGITAKALTNLSVLLDVAKRNQYLNRPEVDKVKEWAETTLASFQP